MECPGNASQCDLSTKPITNRTCMGNTCAQWRVGPWEDCSKSCGNGTQIRHVSCEDHNEEMCGRYEKPRSTQACPGVPCPVWRTGDWSECSVTCGKGMKTRHVACEQVHVNFTCDPLEKPAVVQPCLQKVCHYNDTNNTSFKPVLIRTHVLTYQTLSFYSNALAGRLGNGALVQHLVGRESENGKLSVLLNPVPLSPAPNIKRVVWFESARSGQLASGQRVPSVVVKVHNIGTSPAVILQIPALKKQCP